MWTTTKIEKTYNLPQGSVRRDIHRFKISATKSGNAWLVSNQEVERYYGKPTITGFYLISEERYGEDTYLTSEDEIETLWQNLIHVFSDGFDTLDEVKAAAQWIDADVIAEECDLRINLEQAANSRYSGMPSDIAEFVRAEIEKFETV